MWRCLFLLLLASLLAGSAVSVLIEPPAVQAKDDAKPPDDARSPEDEPDSPEKLEKVTLTLDAGGHTATIRRVLFTRDGTQLITGSGDHSIRVWDVATGEQVRVLRTPGVGSLAQLALSPDGTTLAVASIYPEDDKLRHVIYLMTLADGRVEHLLKGHTELIVGLAFSPDGKRLASSAEDKSIRIWDPAKGQTVKVLQTKLAPPKAGTARQWRRGELAFSPEGDRLAYLQGNCQVIELATGKVMASMPNPKDHPFNGLAWSPDGKTIATTGQTGGFQLWDPAGKSRLQPRGQKTTTAVAFSKEDSGRVLATWNANPYVRATLFDVATGKEVVTFAPKKSSQPDLNSLPPAHPVGSALSPDGKLAATASGGIFHQVFLWNTADGSIVHHLAARSWVGTKTEAGWSADGKAVAWTGPKGATSFTLASCSSGPPPQTCNCAGRSTRREPCR